MGGIFNVVLYAIVGISALISMVGLFGFVPLMAATFLGATGRKESALKRLESTLMADEKLQEATLQGRVFALFHRRLAIAITSSRIIVLRRGILGGFKMQDIQWKDLEDTSIEENVLPSLCGSNLKFKHSNSRVGRLEIKGVDTPVATRMYSASQFQEQAWEEKRRIRGIEEVRAASGGVVVQNGAGHMTSQLSSSGNRVLEEITRAKALLDIGAISDSEFQEMKAKILSTR